MPCYLFTYHCYRSWTPDRSQGYVRRRRGVLPSDPEMAEQYARNALHEIVHFSPDHQLAAVAKLREGVQYITCRLHFVSTDASHLHVLVSWSNERTWELNRTSLKRGLTIDFKKRFGDRPWFSEGASRKKVRDRKHFDYLVTHYLPSHRGWKWCERRGLFK